MIVKQTEARKIPCWCYKFKAPCK